MVSPTFARVVMFSIVPADTTSVAEPSVTLSLSGVYDLVITDVDMPRMDGIQLATLIKQELKSVPVMIVSYKDRPEDRLRGLNAGADYYLTKGDFQDEALVEAVADLIGEAEG